MKKLFISLSVAFALISFVVLEAGNWSLDAGHSRLGFTVKHMGVSETVGQFDKFDVKVTTPNADFSGATIELTAEAKTVNTYLSMRDDHLRSADFFDVEKYPSISFKSTSVKKAKGNEYVVTGNFTMHGTTKTVVLTGTHFGTTKNKAGNDLAGFKITGMVKRSEYGVGVTMPNTVVADEVYLNADLEVVKD